MRSRSLMNRSRSAFPAGSTCLGILALLFLPAAVRAQTDWRYPGNDPQSTRYSPLSQINTRNVTKLRRAWTFHVGDPAGNVNSEGAPLVIDGVMYFDAGKNVFALDPETGRQIWKYETKGTQRRGVAYWPGDKQTSPRIILGVSGNQMLALDAKTGKPAEGYSDGGFVAGVSPSAAPVVYRDLIVTGENRVQMVRAWDAHTGKLVWTFNTKAQPGEPGYESWLGKSWDAKFGTDVWSFMTLDPERGLVFVPIAPSGGTEYYGG